MKQPIRKVAKDKQGKLVSVSFVKNGLKCESFCIDCGEPLVAKNNIFNKKEIHFAHKSKSNCKGSLETYLHKISKIIISENKIINLNKDENFEYTETLIESSIGEIQPDAILKGTKDVIIEIFVTNKKKYDYYQKIKNLNIEAYEIDLSDLSYDTELEEIKKHVLFRIDNKRKLHQDLNEIIETDEIIESTKPEVDSEINSDQNGSWWPVFVILSILGLIWWNNRKNGKKKKRR